MRAQIMPCIQKPEMIRKGLPITNIHPLHTSTCV